MNRSRVTVQTSCRGHFFRVTRPLEVGRANAFHRAVWADIEHPAVVRGITERRFEEPYLGVYESGLLAIMNPWEVVSSSSSGALSTVA